MNNGTLKNKSHVYTRIVSDVRRQLREDVCPELHNADYLSVRLGFNANDMSFYLAEELIENA